MIAASFPIPPNLDAALSGLKPDVMLSAVRRGMSRAAKGVVEKITRNHLSRQGPFPVSAHRLGVRSGRLRESLRATPAQVSGDTITTSIGSVVNYAAAHEFGFSGKVKVKAHQRTAKKVFGVKVANPQPHTVKAHQRKVTIPERAPIRTGITENLVVFSNEITREVKRAFGS